MKYAHGRLGLRRKRKEIKLNKSFAGMGASCY